MSNSSVKIKIVIKEVIFFLLEKLTPLLNKNRSLDKSAIKTILVFEGGGIGDFLMLFPSINAIQKQFPSASISFLVSPYVKDILRLYPNTENILEIIEYDSKGVHQSFFKKLKLIKYIRRNRYDLIYSPSRGEGMREIALMVFLMGSRYRIGFTKGKIGFLNTQSIEFNYNMSILHQNLNLLRKIGVEVSDEVVKTAIPKEDAIFARDLMSEERNYPSCPIISIHPSATWKSRYKSWPLNNYIELIKKIIDIYEAVVVLVGSEEEIWISDRIIKEVNSAKIIKTIGKTTISQMAAVISSTHLFIGNDSGPLHIASALGIPSIGIYGSTSPVQLLSSPEHCLVVKKDLPCSPCYRHQYSFQPSCDSPECLTTISVFEVESAVRHLLTRGALLADRH